METVLIATPSPDDAHAMQRVLDGHYTCLVVGTPAELPRDETPYAVVLLDTDFTPDHGIDVLMELVHQASVPVLMLTAPTEPQCAVEAVRCGAFNYVVKTAHYTDLLPHAIQDALRKCRERDTMQRTIGALQQRVHDLEARLGLPPSAAPEGAVPAVTVPDPKQQLLDAIIERLRRGEMNLPTYPQVGRHLRDLLQAEAPIADIAALLQQDMSLTAHLIQVANSPYYRGMSDVQTLDQALNRLGLQVTQNYVEVITNRALYTISHPTYQPRLQQLWPHALACAYAADQLAAALQLPDADTLFTMGLLHDIGKLLLIQILAELDTSGAFDAGLSSAAVDDLLQTHHGRFGHTLLRRWHLPEVYAEVALAHDALPTDEPPSQAVLVVHCANVLVQHLGYGQPQPEVGPPDTLESTQLLHLAPETLTTVAHEVQALMDGAPLA